MIDYGGDFATRIPEQDCMNDGNDQLPKLNVYYETTNFGLLTLPYLTVPEVAQ